MLIFRLSSQTVRVGKRRRRCPAKRLSFQRRRVIMYIAQFCPLRAYTTVVIVIIMF